MYLLDTNVVSELRKLPGGRCDPAVAGWFAERPLTDCFISVVTAKELGYGVALKERRDPAQAAPLRRWLDQLLSQWSQALLVLDVAIARRAARLHVPDPAPEADVYLAATALESGLTLVTRNTADFRRFDGLRLVNPWSQTPPKDAPHR